MIAFGAKKRGDDGRFEQFVSDGGLWEPELAFRFADFGRRRDGGGPGAVVLFHLQETTVQLAASVHHLRRVRTEGGAPGSRGIDRDGTDTRPCGSSASDGGRG